MSEPVDPDGRQPGQSRLPVALDAMGGDRGPAAAVEGAVAATRDYGIPVLLVGKSAELERLVAGAGGPFPDIRILDAPDVVTMEDHAVEAVRQKSGASVVVACGAVKDGRAGAVVSPGNSGAVVAAAIFSLGRIRGVERPGIAIPFPTTTGQPCYLIDAGAVVDPRPTVLVGYAHLIQGFLRSAAGIGRPRVGLLSNGEEAGKGNQLTREVFSLLAAAEGIQFVGNVEGNQLPRGIADAVVTDGFSGNIALKSGEGAALLFENALRRELTRNWRIKLLAAPLRSAFRRAARSLDYREFGGAPLLGVNGCVYIAHGRSDGRAICNALVAAQRAAEANVVAAMVNELARPNLNALGN